MSEIIIPRPSDVVRLDSSGPWKMVYGRRKTGKSFMVKNFTHYDRFFFVNRDSTVLDEETRDNYTWENFFGIFRELLGNKKIVIDEFHRLPPAFQDYLHATGIKGELVLITSTLWLANKLLGKGSPLAGLVSPLRIDQISEEDMLKYLYRNVHGKKWIEAAIYLREPFIIQQFKNGSIIDSVSRYLLENKFFVRNLIGEIFNEEEKSLTNIYDGILKAVAGGKRTSTEISTFLFSRSLIGKDSPSMLPKYLDMLVGMGILERQKVLNKKRFYYFHSSPIMDLHYYLEEKYSYVDVYTPIEFIKKVVETKLPMHAEQFFRNLLSKHFGMKHEIIDTGAMELDIAFLEFKKLKIVGEVKWKDKISASEIRSIENNLNSFKEARRLLVVPDIKVLERRPEGIDAIDIDALFEELGIAQK
ncbi:MAG: ATPase [Candidatus Marsarchaeota archaeon]|nr:ATPase [Candidatus Marsarchaeota archaeon]MCL5105882.1 ATPase [Candidatus Marsarchaeota archaeon]